MTYTQGGLISSVDYNNFAGSSPSSTANRVNTVWAIGTGDAGYGQAPVTQVSVSNLVTASQWTTLINRINSAKLHQTGSPTTLTTVSSGDLIQIKNTLQTEIEQIYADRGLFSATTSPIIGTPITTFWTQTTNTQLTYTRSFGLRATFSSQNAARFFFNAGGRLKYNVSGARNSSTTARTDAIVNMIGYLGGISNYGWKTNSGRLGTGGTLITNDTTKGFWTSSFNANTTVVGVNSTTSSYTTDTGQIWVRPTGTAGSNGGNGQLLDFIINLTTTTGSFAGGETDAFNVAITQSIDVIYPSTTNLSNTWGAVSISSITF